MQLGTQFNSYSPDLILWEAGFSKLDSVFLKSKSNSKSHCDWRSVSKPWCRAPSGAHDQIFVTVWHLGSCFLWGALSDERTGLSFIYAAGPYQRSLSRVLVLGTLDHILLSQIWDFPFRRLLQLAGSRWRYSTLPPHGKQFFSTEVFFITISQGPHTNYSLSIICKACLQRHCIATEVTRLLLAYPLLRGYIYRVVAY
jgi:hypothetical protein